MLRDVRARPLVDGDRASRVERDACPVEPEPGGRGIAADRGHREVDLERLVVGGQRVPGGPELVTRDHLDPVRDEAARHRLADVGVEAAEHVRATVDQRHAGPEAGEDVRELDADVAAPEDRDPLRQRR